MTPLLELLKTHEGRTYVAMQLVVSLWENDEIKEEPLTEQDLRGPDLVIQIRKSRETEKGWATFRMCDIAIPADKR